MALGAMAANPGLEVQLVPVGLSYFHPHKFRSRAVIEFGAPIVADQSLVDMFKEGGAKKREACGKLLEQVHDGLRAVTLRGPDWETMQVIQAARRLYRIPGQHLTLGQVIELNKRFMEGYLHYQHEPKIIELRKRVLAYNRLLRDMGIADHQVERASNKSVKSFLLLIYRTGLLLWWGMLSLPGVILHAPVFILAKTISHKKAKEALAASTVKIQGRDVLATWKVLVSLAVVPLLYLFYAFVATVYVYRHDVLPEYRKYTPLIAIWLLPSLGYSALKFGEAGMDVAKSLRPLFLSLWPWNQREVNRLRHMREDLTNEIGDCIDEFGPKLYENFDKSRILPSASVPQTGRAPGMIYRKSAAADASVLSHPMSWLDERIFGWSRSASSSVWAGGRSERTEPATAPGSPAESDDEEFEADVDYDDILAIMDVRRNGNPASPRGKKGRSYHDLTAMRAASQPNTPGIINSPRDGYMALPTADDERIPKLTMRKTREDGEDDGQATEGLGLDRGDASGSAHGREKSD